MMNSRYKESQRRIKDLNITEIEDSKRLLDELQSDIDIKMDDIRVLDDVKAAQLLLASIFSDIDKKENTINFLNTNITNLEIEIESLQGNHEKLTIQVLNSKKKLARIKELYKAIEYAIISFPKSQTHDEYFRSLILDELPEADSLAPSVLINLNYMNYKDLRKEFKSYQKHVETLLSEYKDRYKTKTNRTIYQLMVMALQAELQNILYNLKFGKLETGIDQVKQITSKYLTLASEGNQNIVGTLRKFIGELEYLFISEVKVEYEYYIKKDQALQEQQAIRQQMREEAEEKKRLEEQKKQIAIEESKNQFEI